MFWLLVVLAGFWVAIIGLFLCLLTVAKRADERRDPDYQFRKIIERWDDE